MEEEEWRNIIKWGGCFREGILDFIFLFNSGALAGAGEFVGAST